MKNKRYILRFLSLMALLYAFISFSAQPERSEEIQITELPLVPESSKSPRSRLSIIPSTQKKPSESPKKTRASIDPVEPNPAESLMAPPPLIPKKINNPVKAAPVIVKEEETKPAPQIPETAVTPAEITKEIANVPVVAEQNQINEEIVAPAEPVFVEAPQFEPESIPEELVAPPTEEVEMPPAETVVLENEIQTPVLTEIAQIPASSECVSATECVRAPVEQMPVIVTEEVVPTVVQSITPIVEAPAPCSPAPCPPAPAPTCPPAKVPWRKRLQKKQVVRAVPVESAPQAAIPVTPFEMPPQTVEAAPMVTPTEEIVETKPPVTETKKKIVKRKVAKKQSEKEEPKKPEVKKEQAKKRRIIKSGLEETGMKPSQEGPVELSMADKPTGEAEKEFLKEGIESTLTQQEEKKETREAVEKLTKKGTIHLGDYMEPWKGADPNETVEMNFDNKELTELLKFLSTNLDVTFILDDFIEPARIEGLQPLAGTRITFKSNTPLTLKQAWDIGLTFLEMAGFSVIPATLPRTYRVTASAGRDKASANREPLPTFIGIDPELLPDNDSKIRYVYFADNAELATIVQIIDAMKSASAGPVIEVPQLKAVIMTDKAANIKSLMTILREIDRVTLPETLAIIRLRHADARQVRELYYKLIGKDVANPIFNPFARQRKPSTTQFFSEATRVFEEPRTNSLIVLGTRENIKRFEDFIIKYVDKSIDLPFSPLHIIQLKYIDAASIAKILNDVIQKFNAAPENVNAALVGGVRDANKFFRPSVRVTEEPAGNRLIINADYEEYLKLREIIEKLDVEQPQVAIKVLILNVDLSNTETLGTQLRNKVDCCDHTGGLDTILGTNVNFQTNFIGPIVTNPNEPTTATPAINGANRLLGNLINLANRVNGVSPFGIGTTLVTLGQDMFGFWGLLRALETYTRVSVVANPFLVTTHKYKAEIRVGETRRTTVATVEGQREAQAQGDIAADLRVVITPQISYDDMVTLNVYVELAQFTSTDPNNANRLIRKVSTEALLANKEVLALGGLIRDLKNEVTYKIPFLGDIPLVGWLFKNKTYYIERTSLLILIAPEIIKPFEPEAAEAFTFSKINEAKDTLFTMREPAELRDPIHRWMFNDHKNKEVGTIDKFVAMQQRYIDESQKKSEVLALNKPAATKKGAHA